MPVQAKFTADFETFYRAVEKAEVSLKTFADGASTVNQRLTTLGNSFSGTKVIQEAHLMTRAMLDAGGMAALTDKEMRKLGATVGEASDKMRRMGLEVPPGFKAITAEAQKAEQGLRKFGGEATTVANVVEQLGAKFGINTQAITPFLGSLGEVSALSAGLVVGVGAAAVALGKFAVSTIDYADQLSNLSVATGISTAGLQRLEAIGVPAKVSMDDLAKAVEQLHKHLDDPAAREALGRMGLDYQRIRNLKPEQQFLEIAKAVAAVEDPTLRANDGAALFGRTWDTISPAITKDMDDILKSVNVMSDGQVKALDRLGDEWDKFVDRQERRLRGWLGQLVVAAEEAKLHWYDIFNPAGVALKLEKGGRAALIKDLDALPDIPNSPLANPEARFGVNPDVIGRAAQAVIPTLDRAKTATRVMKDEWAALVAKVEGARSPFQQQIDLMHAFDGIMGTLAVDVRNVGNGMAAFGPGLVNLTGGRQIGTGANFGPAKIGSKTFDTGPAKSFADDIFGAVPGSILAAIQGGGSKFQAAGSAIGASLFGKDSSATKAITSGLGKLFGPDSAMTKALGGAIPVIGSLIGPAIEGLGKLWGKVFGTAGRDAVRDFASSQGGFDTLHQKLGALGADGETLWKNLTQGVGRNNPEQAKAAIEKVTAAFELQRQKILTLQGTLDSVTAKLGRITTISPDLQAALDKAFDPKNPEAMRLALLGINTEIDKQQAKFDLVKNTLAKYGISFTDAGKDFKQAQINETAQGLIEDFKILEGAGVGVKQEVHGMSKELSQFASDAKKAGVEVPEDMRKILQAAIDNGELFDDNGVKITDLKQLGLDFGTTMDTVMKHTIPDAIANLTIVLQGLADFLKIKLPGAAADGAAGMNDALSKVHPPDLSSPDYGGFGPSLPEPVPAALGGTITPFGLQYFASGSRGRVLPWRPRGTDVVPAMLTPGETVRTKSQESALQSQLASGAAPHVSIYIDQIVTSGDPQSVAESLKTAMENDTARIRTAIEITARKAIA